MTRYPHTNEQGTMIALRASMQGLARAEYGAERLAHDCSELVRLSRRHHGIAVKRCNVPTDERDDRREARLRERIIALVSETFTPAPTLIEFGGDPRGSTVKLEWQRGTRAPFQVFAD